MTNNKLHPTEIIAISSGKGGTGKTLLAASLGFALGYCKHRVLMIDTDTGTDGLSLFLLGTRGTKHAREFRENQTFTGMILGLSKNNSIHFQPRPIARDEISRLDPRGDPKNEVRFQALISTPNIVGKAKGNEAIAPYVTRKTYQTVVRQLFDQIHDSGDFDYVIVDTRGGFGFESSDVCALADSYIIVTEPDYTSYYQDFALVNHIRAAADHLDRRPVLRGVLVNKSIHGDEESFRAILVKDLPISLEETYSVPLDMEAIESNRNHNLPYIFSPGSAFSQATLRAFGEMLSLVTTEWTEVERGGWQHLVNHVTDAAKRKRRRQLAKRYAIAAAILVTFLVPVIGVASLYSSQRSVDFDFRVLAQETAYLQELLMERRFTEKSAQSKLSEREETIVDLRQSLAVSRAASDVSEANLRNLNDRHKELVTLRVQDQKRLESLLIVVDKLGADLTRAERERDVTHTENKALNARVEELQNIVQLLRHDQAASKERGDTDRRLELVFSPERPASLRRRALKDLLAPIIHDGDGI